MEGELLNKIAMHRLQIKETDLQMTNTKIRSIRSSIQRSPSSHGTQPMEKIEAEHIEFLNSEIKREVDHMKSNGITLAEFKLFDKHNMLEKYISPYQLDSFAQKPRPQITRDDFDKLVSYSRGSTPVAAKRQSQVTQFSETTAAKTVQHAERSKRNLTTNNFYQDKMEALKRINQQREKVTKNYQQVMQQETATKYNFDTSLKSKLEVSKQRSSDFFNTRSQSLGQQHLNNSTRTLSQHNAIQQQQQLNQEDLKEKIDFHQQQVNQRLNQLREISDQKFGVTDTKIAEKQAKHQDIVSQKQQETEKLVVKRSTHVPSTDAGSIRRAEQARIQQYEREKQRNQWSSKIQMTQSQQLQSQQIRQDQLIGFVPQSAKQFEHIKEQIQREYKERLQYNKKQTEFFQNNELIDEIKRQKVIEAKRLKDQQIAEKGLSLSLKYERTRQCIQKQQEEREEEKFFLKLLEPVQRMSERRIAVKNRSQSANPLSRFNQSFANNQSFVQQQGQFGPQ